MQEWRHKGLDIHDHTAKELLLVESPSRRDLESGVKALGHKILSNRNSEEYRKVEEQKHKGEFVLPFDLRNWEKMRDVNHFWKADRDIIRKFIGEERYILGSVIAATEKERVVPSTDDNQKLSIRDWALVQPQSQASVGGNNVSCHRPLYQLANKSLSDGPRLHRATKSIGHLF